MNRLEAALIALSNATDGYGKRVRIDVWTRDTNIPFYARLNGAGILQAIQLLTAGVPLSDGETPFAVHRNHAKNIQLVLDVYKAWIEETLA